MDPKSVTGASASDLPRAEQIATGFNLPPDDELIAAASADIAEDLVGLRDEQFETSRKKRRGMDPAAAAEAAQAGAEQIETSRKKVGRGRARASWDLIQTMLEIAETVQPVTGRGIGYKLFVAGLIAAMSVGNMQKVYRLLKEAREEGIIPWEWIVDETRALERVSMWGGPSDYVRTIRHAYRRNFWLHQPKRVEVWSEKGTVRGVLAPVLDELGVGFRVLHGFSGATTVHEVAQDSDRRPLVVLYTGDWDPSGLCMSEHDLPERLGKYGGDHIILKRIALTKEQLEGLPAFSAGDKKGDPRYKWFVKNYGQECWELDALDPNILRATVEAAIRDLIEPTAWARCEHAQSQERASLERVLDRWNNAPIRRQCEHCDADIPARPAGRRIVTDDIDDLDRPRARTHVAANAKFCSDLCRFLHAKGKGK
jgi:hypothetical protein